MMKYPNCNSICVPDVVVGGKYQYYESMPTCIWDVELIEDNSTEENIELKLKVLKHIYGIKVNEGTIFEVSMINEPIAFGGMWKLYPAGEYIVR